MNTRFEDLSACNVKPDLGGARRARLAPEHHRPVRQRFHLRELRLIPLQIAFDVRLDQPAIAVLHDAEV